MVNGVEIIGLAATVTVFDEETPFGFCNVFTNRTFIGMPLLVVVSTVPLPPEGFAQMNCCGLKLNCAVLVCTLDDGFIRIFVGTKETENINTNKMQNIINL